MGKKKKKSLNTMGTADNPFKCVKGSGCSDKACNLWHPSPDINQLPQFNQKTQEEVDTNLKHIDENVNDELIMHRDERIQGDILSLLAELRL